MIDVDLPEGDTVPELVRSFAACLASVTEASVVEVSQPRADVSGALAPRRGWLAGSGAELVALANPATFTWPSYWLAVVREPGSGSVPDDGTPVVVVARCSLRRCTGLPRLGSCPQRGVGAAGVPGVASSLPDMCSTTMERVARPGGPPPEAGAGLTGALEWLDLAVRRLTDLGAAGVGRGGRVGGGLALHRLGPALASLDGVRLLLLGAVDADGRWAVDGSRSAVAWLARFTRSGRAAAGVEVRTARALRERLPLTAAALLYGRVTVGHARVLARLCLRTPDDDRRAG